MRFVVSFFLLFSLTACGSAPSPREVVVLEEGWLFTREDSEAFAATDYDASNWQQVRVPHDWAIAGPFDMTIDRQKVKVLEDGESRELLRAGRTGALPFIGTGWYRYDLGSLPLREGQCYRLEFDGAMSRAEVYVNGQLAGTRPYGYSSFAFDITDLLQEGSRNIVAVRLENLPESSRWYPGAGLYRHVRLVRMSPVHVAHWGTCVTTPQVGADSATVVVRTGVENLRESPDVELKTTILDPDGRTVAESVVALSGDRLGESVQEFRLGAVRKWDIDSPQLYTAVSTLSENGRVVDEYSTPFGIRSFSFDSERGFSLNGRRVALQGVCLHHDLGPLGAAVNRRAIERQLEIMKQMGCNAIRTSHNPAAPELLDLCDRMGLLVMEESFDEWRIPKNRNGYSPFFDQWAERDLADMIRRDRNHPSIVIWSIGNEVREQNRPEGVETARFLAEVCRREDPTRPVTVGMNNHVNALKNGFGEVLDLVGFNYKPHTYGAMHEQYPDYCILGSETASTVSSRGKYYLPAREFKTPFHDDFHCSSYGLEYPAWASTPDTEFAGQDDNPFVAGEFVWTGFDYLGEPTPYNETLSSRSSYFGIVDLAGMKKDRYYLYQSRWSDRPVLHLLPHWNWHEGDRIPVHCYTNYPAVELFLNGRSLGRRTKNPEGRLDRYRMIWEDVAYEAGTLRAVAYDAQDRACEERIVRTAGEPDHLTLEPDRTRIEADGRDLSFVEISVVDAQGTLCPDAALQLEVSVRGGELVALCNGDPTSLESFAGQTMKTFSGKCMAVISGTPDSRTIRVRVSTPEGVCGETRIETF